MRVSDFNGAPRVSTSSEDNSGLDGKAELRQSSSLSSEDDGVLYCALDKTNGLQIASDEKTATEEPSVVSMKNADEQ